ncbi:MAG: ATP-binding cassette domain-containing protein [Thiohalocapsa sp.]|jgi:putative ABC transport system ATP-binding protein
MVPASPIYICEGLVKRRAAAGAGFELRVPRLRIRPGEICVLQGASGSGKSTLLDLLAMALRPDAADSFSFRASQRGPTDLRRLWQRHDLDSLGRLRGAHVGYVLQTGGLLSFLTARENIELSCRLLGRKSIGLVEKLADRLGIGPQLDKYPAQLSVGERQRVAIARAMAHQPSVVLADEPTASVDPLNAAAILELLLELARDTGATAIIASHDWRPKQLPDVHVLEHRIERAEGWTRSLFWN